MTNDLRPGACTFCGSKAVNVTAMIPNYFVRDGKGRPRFKVRCKSCNAFYSIEVRQQNAKSEKVDNLNE